MPTITFLIALFFASFAPATTNTVTVGKNDSKTTKVTTKGKPNNGDFIIGGDINP